MTTSISRQSNLHFQNFIVLAFPQKKNSVFGRFSSLAPRPTPLKSANYIFIVVSPSLIKVKSRSKIILSY